MHFAVGIQLTYLGCLQWFGAYIVPNFGSTSKHDTKRDELVAVPYLDNVYRFGALNRHL